MTKQSKWIHPIHGRGIRSPDLASLVKGKPLTDKRIKHYILSGRYGEEAQQNATKKKIKRVGKKKTRQTEIARALKHLLNLSK